VLFRSNRVFGLLTVLNDISGILYWDMAYAFSYIVSGWENEYLARMIPALLSVSCLPAAYLIGRRLIPERASAGHLAGMLSASILAFTPAFVRWASSGYVDLPMAYYWALAVLFCL